MRLSLACARRKTYGNTRVVKKEWTLPAFWSTLEVELRLFHNSLLSKWFRDTANDSVSSVRGIQRSRGTGPRATVVKAALHRRARACPSPSLVESNDHGGQAPALRLSRPPPFIVGRGPVPRHASRCEKNVSCSLRSVGPKTPLLTTEIAGDRPPRYGIIETGMSLLPGRH